MSQCIQVVTSVSLQGGGPGSECDDTTDPFNGKRFTVRMLPMEVVTMPQRIKVVEFGSLIEIPCELQVRQAISNLHKQQSDYPDKFSYIKFPFGIIGYDGLDMLLKYHEYITLKKKVAEEKSWLEQAKQNYGSLGIDIDKIYQYLQENVWSTGHNYHIDSIRTLVGERWLTDDVIDTVFGIINRKHDDTICFVCKPTRIVYSSAGLSEKLRRIYDNSFTVSRVIVALNVGYDDRGTYYVSDEKRRGVHWALLVIDVENGTSYYGESLGWSVPGNLADTVGSNLKRMEEDLGISVITALENVIDMNKFSCDASNTGSASCKLFYQLQSCSHVCGVIVVCMAVVLCDYWEIWLSCGKEMGEGPLLSNPSTNSMQLSNVLDCE